MLQIFKAAKSRHKLAVVIIALMLASGGYFGYKALKGSSNEVRYVTAVVEKGTLIISVSGSGQVSASDQAYIKAKASGDLMALNIKSGQEVKAGDLLAQMDNSDAKKTVRDAETALETARLELNKLLAPADEVDVLKAENGLAAATRNLEELENPSKETLSQAENSLISVQDSLTKLKFSQESSYQNAIDAKQKAEDNLTKTYDDTFNTVANTFLGLPTIITKLNDIFYSYEIGASETIVGRSQNNTAALINSRGNIDDADSAKLQDFQTSAQNDYKTARSKYNTNLDHYKSASRYSDRATIEALLAETLETTKSIAEAIKSESNYLDAWADYRSGQNLAVFTKVKDYQTNLAAYIGQTNGYLSNLLSSQRTLEDNREAITAAERNLKELEQNQPLDLAAAARSVKEKEDTLAKLKNPEQYDIEAARIAVKEKGLALSNLKAGADELDIRAKKIAVQQKEDALLTARQNLADCDIQASFDGVIAEMNVKKGDSISSGAAIATVITKQKIAEIALNEIDAAQIKVGQKTTLTFDAASDLAIAGEVAEIDTIGTVSQGVVTYSMKIAFGTEDERVKPGMSVSASIITDVKQDVLLAPLSAVKSSGNGSYAETLVNNQPQRKTITTGSSNDTMIEIVEGLQEKDQVVTQTINTGLTSNQSGSSSSSSTRNGGNQNFMGGMGRMMRGD